MHAAVEHLDQQIERLLTDSGISLREHVRAQRHRRAHDRNRKGIADARRVASEEIDLQRIQLIGGNLHFGEVAEAGVDAVGRRIVLRELVDDRARRAHATARCIAERNRVVVRRDRNQLIECQRIAVEFDHGTIQS